MEEIEVPLEQSQEHIQHHAEHSEGKKWVLGVALSSAIFAALAAVASLRAGYHANEALLEQISANNEILKESDQWTYYQAKGIKSAVLASRVELLRNLDRNPSEAELTKLKDYDREQKEITEAATKFREHADRLKEEGKLHLEHHEKLATAVTMFQICIATSAISVLTARRLFWFVSLLFGAIGVFYMVAGLFIH